MSKNIATILGIILFFAAVMLVKGDFNPLSTAYAIGDLTVNWGVAEGNPIFVVSNMAPGESQTRSVGVNNGASTSRPVGVRGIETSDPANLSDKMHIEVKQGSTIIYGPKTLTQFFTESGGPSGVPLTTLSPSSAVSYTFKVTFDSDAGNIFQNKQMIFDLKIGIAIDIPSECNGVHMDGNLPIFGTQGNDTIKGTKGNDIIFALEGNDTVNGNGGNDCIIGGPGNDTLTGNNGNDIIFGNEGNDVIKGGNGNDLLIGGVGADKIDGGNGQDHIFGNEDNDDIDGGNEDDVIEGGSGNDKIDGGNQDDTINGDSGNDTINGGNGKDTIHGGDDNDTITGGNDKDTLVGDGGIDSTNGGNGIDICSAETKTQCEL